MAFNFETSANANAEQKNANQQLQTNDSVNNGSVGNNPDADILGLSAEEILDPNTIDVTISDKDTPLVILFGAKTSGKTMTLIRLARYLEENLGYTIEPDPIFRPAHDLHYKRMCREFKAMTKGRFAPTGTDVMSYMLLKISDDKGNALCQILEAPGEHYFDEEHMDRITPEYITKIQDAPNRKTWIVIVEENWGTDQTSRANYVSKIHEMVVGGNIIFMCHKVDLLKNRFLPGSGNVRKPNDKQIMKDLQGQYPNIFEPYKNRNPFTSFATPYLFSFVSFSSGTFTPVTQGPDTGKQKYSVGPDFYAEELWKQIKKNI